MGDREKEDVDLTWARIPARRVWRRDRTAPGGRRQEVKTTVPQLLVGLGPEHSQNLDAAWVREKDKMFAIPGDEKKEKASVKEIISANKASKRLENYEKDLQRIKSSGDESIRALTAVRKKVTTDVGNLKLLFEVLRKAVDINDHSLAFDVLWAIEENPVFQKTTAAAAAVDASAAPPAAIVAGSADSKEKYKEMKIAFDKKNPKELQHEAEIRGLPTKGNKKDLIKVLMPRIKDECEGKVAPPSTEAVAAEKDGKKEKKSKKDKEDKKSSKKDKEEKKAKKTSEPAPASIEDSMVAEYLPKVELVKQWRDELSHEELIRMQLTDMSHLLPPLSPFTQKFKLDMWQKQVLRYVDEKKSCLVCAPTSSGKTVISSYVASQGKRLDLQQTSTARGGDDDDDELIDSSDDEEEADDKSGVDSVLFVVPSEPLVWQVAAHFAKCSGLDSKVGLVTDIMTYVPSQRAKHYKGAHKAPPRVTVGTPLALESALTKVRGFMTHKEMHDQEDRAQPAGGFQYKWVVFDEVHALEEDSPDGKALQRLIKMLNCNFLALSATVGNADQLRSWFESVKGEQIACETVEALPDGILKNPLGKVDLAYLQEKCFTTGLTKGRLVFTKVDAENVMTVLSSIAASSNATTKLKMEFKALELKKPVENAGALLEGMENLSKLFPHEIQKLLDYFNPQRHNSVKLQVHEGRFINLQRHVWVKEEDSDEMTLEMLHPLAAVTMEFLQKRGFDTTSLPMTSRDSQILWNRMKELYPMEAIQHLDPVVNFPLADGRITLEATKGFEHRLKGGLHELVQSFPTQTEALLKGFTLVDPPKDFNVYDIVTKLNNVDPHSGLTMLPALVFHLDVFELIGRFHELLTGLEAAQHKKYPDYYESVLTKLTQTNNAMSSALKGCSTQDEKDRVMRDFVNMGQADLEQPHPDFVLSRGVSRQEFDKICKEVEKEDKFGSNSSQHALMRALRRGIGVIIEEVTFQAYRRAVMRLATQGKLAVVFSDRSLAFGVNMPFRSCVFCGDMGGRLDALMQQQMAGRAGRRGLDTQGHLVYAGTSAESIRSLMLAKVSDIHGSEPCYHTQFIPEAISGFVNPDSFPNMTKMLGDDSLFDINHGKIGLRPNFNDISRDFLLEMGFLEECDVCNEEEAEAFGYTFREYADDRNPISPSGFRPRAPYNCALLWALWELRSYPAQSVAIAAFFPFILEDMYRNNQNSAYWISVEGQLEFLFMLIYIIDRRPVVPGEGKSLRDHPFIANENIKTRDNLRARIETMNQMMNDHHDRINTMMDGKLLNKESLILPVPIGDPIDDKLFNAVRDDTTKNIPKADREEVKERVWHLGVMLRTLYNSLYIKKDKFGSLAEENRFHVLGTCIRKCFQRITYVSRDLIQETIDVPNSCSFEMEGGVDGKLAEYQRSMGILKGMQAD